MNDQVHRFRRRLGRLPEATTDMTAIQRDFHEFGYALVKDCLSTDEVARLRERIVEQGEAECRQGIAHLADGGKHYYGSPAHGGTASFQLIRVLPNKGEIFRRLILNPAVTEVMEHGFGGLDFCLSNLTAMITRDAVPAQVLHCDQSYLPDPVPRAWVCNALYMITDFTEENGATRVVPGSHRSAPPSMKYFRDGTIEGYEQVETMPVEGEAGTALVFDGRLWHGAGPSRVPGPRLAVSAYYMITFLRQSENYPACVHPDIYAELSRQQRDMLGFKHAATLNHIEPAFPGGRSNSDADYAFTPELK